MQKLHALARSMPPCPTCTASLRSKFQPCACMSSKLHANQCPQPVCSACTCCGCPCAHSCWEWVLVPARKAGLPAVQLKRAQAAAQTLGGARAAAAPPRCVLTHGGAWAAQQQQATPRWFRFKRFLWCLRRAGGLVQYIGCMHERSACWYAHYSPAPLGCAAHSQVHHLGKGRPAGMSSAPPNQG